MARRKGKVLAAMSGGVDSSVAAAILLREGYEVVGCFMRLGTPGDTFDELIPHTHDERSESRRCESPSAREKHRGCCSVGDAADARLVAAHLGIPFYVCNFRKDFGRIIDYFADEYLAGRTPNPCVRCNDWLKFGRLHEYAKRIGAAHVASGHYARIVPSEPEAQARDLRLLRGRDRSKDQSYVLFGVARERLGEMLLPIGEFEKGEVRAMAREWGLPVFDKPDSQEICFVPDDDYAGLVERHRPGSSREGAIVDTAGRIVGRHGGQHRFTIGQRRGLSVSLGRAVYVVGKDAATNTIVVGDRAALECPGCTVNEANWLIDPPEAGRRFRAWAKIRYGAEPVPAEVIVGDDAEGDTPSGRRGTFEVRFEAPQCAATPGQALALYDAKEPDRLIGGGWIVRAAR